MMTEQRSQVYQFQNQLVSQYLRTKDKIMARLIFKVYSTLSE